MAKQTVRSYRSHSKLWATIVAWFLIVMSCSKPPLPDYSSKISIELMDKFDSCFIDDTIQVNAVIYNRDTMPVSIPVYYSSLFRLVDKLPEDYFYNVHRSCWFLSCGISGDSSENGFIYLKPKEEKSLLIKFLSEGKCEGFIETDHTFILHYMVDVVIPERKARYSVTSESTIKLYFKNGS